MEFSRVLSSREIDPLFISLRREWVNQSQEHARIHELSSFVLCVRQSVDPLGANEFLKVETFPMGSYAILGLLERSVKFTRARILGYAPVSAFFERDGKILVSAGVFTDPKAFVIQAPRSLSNSKMAILYIKVFCFYDDPMMFARVKQNAGPELADHLDQLRDVCMRTKIHLGPEMLSVKARLLG